MQHLRLLSIAIAVAGLASVADAKPKAKAKGKGNAKAHIDKATKAHKEGKFDVALTELQAAYDIDPQPKLLFAIAQVQVKLDDCPAAIDNYNKFLESTKDKQKQEVVKQAIAACKDKDKAVAEPKPDKPDSSVFRKDKDKDKEKEPAPPPAPEVIEATPPAPPAPEPTPAPPPAPTPLPITKFDEPTRPAPAPTPHHKAFYRDILGDVLVLAGVGVGAYSFIEYRAATKDLDNAEHASSIDAYNDLVNSAHDKRKMSVVFAGGGVVLLGAGILRYALRSDGESHRVALVPTHSGGLITWTGGF